MMAVDTVRIVLEKCTLLIIQTSGLKRKLITQYYNVLARGY
jgi:hypothetical protein